MNKLKLVKMRAITMALLLTIIMVLGGFSCFSLANADSIEIEKYEEISDYFEDGRIVVYEKEIYDFDINKFILYEMEPMGYAIFSVKGNSKIFLEGSDNSWSPYHKYLNKELRYLGLGNYFFEEDGNYFDVVTGDCCNGYELLGSYTLADELYIEKSKIISRAVKFPSSPDADKTTTYGNYVCVKNYSYIESLSSFPKNKDGTCAIVALCILLGYLDEYVDDRFIPDNGQYNGLSFKNGSNPSQSLHDYLFDNCLHTILGVSNSDGYPMANMEIKNMMKDYLDNQCGVDFRKQVNFVDGSILYTHANPRKHINAGYPSIITMTKYTTTYKYLSWEVKPIKEKYHTVVAYGYNKDKDTFRVNFGYDPSRSGGVIISGATIYSYNTFTL